MPQYEFRCNCCGLRFVVSYKTFDDYETASVLCIECGKADVTRVISQVAIGKSNRDYSRMSSGEMLSVLESGDQRQVDRLFRQVGETSPQKLSPSVSNQPGRRGNSARDRAQTSESD